LKKEAKREALKKERDAAQRFATLEGKGLGDADEGEMDTRAWLLQSKKRQKKIAKERQRMLEEELAERENQAEYTEKDLSGMRIAHEVGAFDDGAEQIVTLKDAAVDAEDSEDELENMDLRDKEKTAERLELKKRKPVYDPLADDGTGKKSILAHYDEEIDGKKQRKFTLGALASGGGMKVIGDAGDVASGPQGTRFSLDFMMDDKQPVSDYMDISDIKIRKPKKKKEKSKKQRSAEDDALFPLPEAPAPDAMDLDEPQSGNGAKRSFDNVNLIDDDDLQSSLAMQRRVALKKRKLTRPEDLARQLREEEASAMPDAAMKGEEDGGLVIDETSEFVANLQKPAAPTKKEPTLHSSTVTIKPDPSASPPPASAEILQPDPDIQAPATSLTTTGLDVEATLDLGIGSTLSMITQRGLIKSAASGDLNAQHRDRQRFLADKQRIEDTAELKARTQRERDRASGKFERMSAREREQYAQWENKARDQADSRQMADVFNREYKPQVDLKYVDDFGRSMNQREAFKHLSHQFHGKGSGKQKTEKYLKKIEDERSREAKSSLDASQAAGLDRAMGATAKKNRTAGVRLQ